MDYANYMLLEKENFKKIDIPIDPIDIEKCFEFHLLLNSKYLINTDGSADGSCLERIEIYSYFYQLLIVEAPIKVSREFLLNIKKYLESERLFKYLDSEILFISINEGEKKKKTLKAHVNDMYERDSRIHKFLLELIEVIISQHEVRAEEDGEND